MRVSIGNSMSQIVDMTPEHYQNLRRVLSYKVPGSYFSNDPTGGIRYLITKRGEFATGLLERVKSWAEASKLLLQLTDLRKRPGVSPNMIKATLGFKTYEVQDEAANACYTHHRGIVQAPTGCGKSVMIALTVDRLKVPTLVVVPSLELKRQLTESLTATFGRKAVGELGKPIAVMNIQSLDPKAPLKGYPCVIIDEYHHSAAKSYLQLNKYAWNDVYYRFGFTATPYRSQDEEQALLESILSEVIYVVPYQTAVERGYIVPLEAYYVELPKTPVTGQTWAQVYKELVVNNLPRNDVIQDILISLKDVRKSILCLVKEVAHGEKFEHLAPYAHGENEATADLISTFNLGSRALIATTGVCGEGVDTKPCEYVILAGLGKSRPALMQAFGRCFRTYPGKTSGKIILFKDNSHKWTKAHFKEQRKVLLDEYGVIPAKLELK